MDPTDQQSYRRFRDIYAERTNRIVAWIGAGMSTEVGVPLWSELRERLHGAVEDKARTYSQHDGAAVLKKLQVARGLTDLWLAFEQLEDILGETTFAEVIRTSLACRDKSTPTCYERLWSLRLDGILNLNLDGLATKTFYSTRATQEAQLLEFQGDKCGSFAHVLKLDLPFLVNLHGTLQDKRSWVFTRRSLKGLRSSPGYRALITSIFASRTVLFLGVRADDLAAGGLLAELRELNVDVGSHFWMTERQDSETDKWAENCGIQIIRYEAKNGDHSQLHHLLADLGTYLPLDAPDKPVTPKSTTTKSLSIEPSELAAKEPEAIRKALNSMASEILQDDTDAARKAYLEFRSKYDYPISRANYVSLSPPHNEFFGYVVDRQIGKGLFGRVYHALDAQGNSVAIKILKDDVRENPKLLSAFRRGVRSMQILSDRNVPGMVPYLFSFEIPTCAIMDYVDGPNLDAAIASGRIKDWSSKLRIARSLVGIIRTGHLLPERVLHRDLRPQNIMLRESRSGDPPEVVVLDFDLSWHKDAAEKSVDLGSAAALAYAAPEQLHPVPGVSTRNALVDSFGIGMTLFHLFSGESPTPGDYKRHEWHDTVRSKLFRHSCKDWRSLPARLAGLIFRSTRVEQARRCDCSAIERELERLLVATTQTDQVEAAELWADELAARAWGIENYKWSHDGLLARKVFANGVGITLRGDESLRKVFLESSWSSAGDDNWRNVGKFLNSAAEKSVASLRSGGWQAVEKQRGEKNLRIEANIPVSVLQSGCVTDAARAVGELANSLSLSSESLGSAIAAITAR